MTLRYGLPLRGHVRDGEISQSVAYIHCVDERRTCVALEEGKEEEEEGSENKSVLKGILKTEVKNKDVKNKNEKVVKFTFKGSRSLHQLVLSVM